MKQFEVHGLYSFYRWTFRDSKTGRFLGSSKREPAHSYVGAMADFLGSAMIQTSGNLNGNNFLSGADTSNATNTVPSSTGASFQSLPCVSGATVITYGLVVGTGAGANTIDTYHLTTIVANGNGAGALNYGACGFTNPSTAGATRSFSLTRTFTGNAVGDVVLTEVGIYALLYSTTGAAYYCVVRDLLGVSKTIHSTVAATLTYTVGVTAS